MELVDSADPDVDAEGDGKKSELPLSLQVPGRLTQLRWLAFVLLWPLFWLVVLHV